MAAGHVAGDQGRCHHGQNAIRSPRAQTSRGDGHPGNPARQAGRCRAQVTAMTDLYNHELDAYDPAGTDKKAG